MLLAAILLFHIYSITSMRRTIILVRTCNNIKTNKAPLFPYWMEVLIYRANKRQNKKTPHSKSEVLSQQTVN